MEKIKIIEILHDWNFWRKELDIGIAREIYTENIRSLAKTGQILCITGVRRSGKSTLLLQHAKKLIEEGAESSSILIVNLEDQRFSEPSLKLLQDIYETYLEFIGPKTKPYIFLDEVQNINAWEKFVRSLHERKEAKIFVSGSSSKLMSKEFATLLTGRHLDINVYPLSFEEFLFFKGVALEKHDILDLISKRITIKAMLREYLEFGGFPLVVINKEKKQKEKILREYFDDIITKDVVNRYKIKKTEKLKEVARYYLTNISSLASFRRVKKFIGLSLDTVERFSSYFEEACFLFFLKKFSYSLKEQEVNPRKVYCIDIGLRNAVSFRFIEDIGKLYENAAAIELKRREKEVYYWKDRQGREVDFLVKEGMSIKEAIQVCYNIEDEKTKEREIKGLLNAMNEFNLNEGIIITEDLEEEEKINGKTIKYMPLWKWLLE